MNCFNVVEMGHVVTLIAPVSAGVALTSDIFSMANWEHASIIVSAGAGSGLTVTLYECVGFGATGATLIGYQYAQEEVAGGDTLGAALTAAGTGGVSMTSASGIFMVIELDHDQLSDGYPCVRLNTSAAAARLVGATAILSGGRYQEDITATAIA